MSKKHTELTRRNFLHKSMRNAIGCSVLPYIHCSRRPKSRPNILFLCTDEQHSFTLNRNADNDFVTPALDKLAAGGVNFTNAFCTTPQCSASRAAILTGQYPHRTGVITNLTCAAGRGIPLNPALPTIGRIFQQHGYTTAYYGKWHLGGDPENHGWQVYERTRGHETTQSAVSFLQAEHDQPFFLFCSYFNPHDVYQFRSNPVQSADVSNIQLPRSFADDLSGKPAPQRRYMTEDYGSFMENVDEQMWKSYRRFYREKVEQVDAEIGRVLEALDTSGHRENTLIVCTSDHGDMDAAHRMVLKGPFMYEEVIRVPLVFSYPGNIPAGVKRSQLVQNFDIFPTLAGYAGIALPHRTDGQSLLSVIQDAGAATREEVYCEFYAKQEWITPIRTIRTQNWKYSRYIKWGEELYNLEKDPLEMDNLAAQAQYQSKKEELHNRLKEWMNESDDYFTKLKPTDRRGMILDV